MTREQGAETGTRLYLDGGTVTERSPVGSPEGTTMIVRDLFFNTPARLKFMKTDRAEGSYVTTVAVRCALSHPEVSIKYIKDGKEEFHTPGDNRRESCIYSIFGRDFALGLIPAATDDGTVKVEGFISAPKDARGNRNNQFFFVNGRCVKSRLLQTALEQGYKNNLFVGRFPSCVLYIELSPHLVDVNVHPAKTEVKFLSERQVFDGVYYATLSALAASGEAPVIEVSEGTKAAVKSHVSEGGFHKAAAIPKENFFTTKPASGGGSFFKSSPPQDAQQDLFRDGYSAPYRTSQERKPYVPDYTEAEQALTEPAAPERPEYRYIGETMDTYILVERGDELMIIDKHAAHERMIFDRLKTGGQEVMSQPLLVPAVCRMTGDEVQTILDGMELLAPLGYEIDAFGDDSIAVRAVPADTDASDIPSHMEELAGIIASAGKQGLDAAREELLHSVACKAAIKAGKPSTREELTVIADKVVAGEIKYCPHGRPVSVTLTKQELDRRFKRT
jgi:DNA mismatch repair protein MutL